MKHKTIKKNKKKLEITYNKTLYILMIIIILLIFQNITIYNQFNNMSRTTEQQSTEINMPYIIQKLNENPDIQPYSTYNKNTKHLTQEEIYEYSKTEPAIYDGLKGDNIYIIEYFSENNGLFILYDTDENKILKMFKTTKMLLN